MSLEARLAAARDVFLSRAEVIARYGWSRSTGYEVTSRPDFPRSIVGRYRLDTLLAWEEEQLAAPAPDHEFDDGPRRRRPRVQTGTLGPQGAPLGDLTLVPADAKVTLDRDPGRPSAKRRTTRATP